MNPCVHLHTLHDAAEKLVGTDALARLREDLDARGQRLAFTNGCFDILHEGHIRYLNEAARLADCLAVALNSDASARRLKGPGRPVRTQDLRVKLIAALPCVDHVVVFNEEHVAPLVRIVRPHVYVKGGDYTMDTIESSLRAALEELGIETHFVGHVPGVSTTNILSTLPPEAMAAVARGEPPPPSSPS